MSTVNRQSTSLLSCQYLFHKKYCIQNELSTVNCQLAANSTEYNIKAKYQLSTVSQLHSLAANSFFYKNILLKTNCQVSTVSWLPIRTEYSIKAKCQLSTVSQLYSSAANSFFTKNIVFKTNCQLAANST